ncbi:MAG: hypothetical protein HZC39_13240 [Chloroflexi bacterium]|nr:hypothetical protein [Chloroflexota bacterium]MBI5704491.1 hypothetical protein [Chloroflexota bacterium]GER78846.1 conserved hypothetical protein [Candidatus Denitrolinea symbiosum]
MKATLSFRALAITFFIALTVSYLLCIAADLWFGFRTLQALAPFLPGFTWPLTFSGFLVGLLWIAVCSAYSAAMIAFPYNYLVKWEQAI